ncbi:MAG: hypothetical protein AB1547_13575 [Thermodesulfobacteriota bacterium]
MITHTEILEEGLKLASASTKAETENSKKSKSFLPSDARTNLPEYSRWQNAMRPEDTGRAEGCNGIPETNATVSQFEETVRCQLENRLLVTRNKYAQDDFLLKSQIDTMKPEYERIKKLFEAKHNTIKRPLIIYFSEKQGMACILAITLLGMFLWFVFWDSKGLPLWIAISASIVSACILSLMAYPCGLAIRQGKSPLIQGGAACILIGIIAVVIVLGNQIPSSQYNDSERLLIAFLISLTPLIVASSVFLMHDADAEYESLTKRFLNLHRDITDLENRRWENRIFHTNVGKRHIELAHQMIATYRASNVRSRPAENPPPGFFSQLPCLPIIKDSWLTEESIERTGSNTAS